MQHIGCSLAPIFQTGSRTQCDVAQGGSSPPLAHPHGLLPQSFLPFGLGAFAPVPAPAAASCPYYRACPSAVQAAGAGFAPAMEDGTFPLQPPTKQTAIPVLKKDDSCTATKPCVPGFSEP
jgi:hypothetical protein